MGCSTSKGTQVLDKASDAPSHEKLPKPKAADKIKQTVQTPPASGAAVSDLPEGPDVEKPAEAATSAPAAVATSAPAADATPASAAGGPEGETLPAGTRVIFVLGGPGSGKGTQCEKIVAKYGFQHLSAGDLLRAEVKSGSALGQELESTMKEGRLVPTEVTVRLLKKAMLKSPADTFLIDGFPRALDQAEVFERDLQPCVLILFFDLDEDTMKSRLLKRGETSGRADDNEATIVKRFNTFHTESLPVITHYEKGGKVARISAAAPPDVVFTRVEEALDALPGVQPFSDPQAAEQVEEGEALLAA